MKAYARTLAASRITDSQVDRLLFWAACDRPAPDGPDNVTFTGGWSEWESSQTVVLDLGVGSFARALAAPVSAARKKRLAHAIVVDLGHDDLTQLVRTLRLRADEFRINREYLELLTSAELAALYPVADNIFETGPADPPTDDDISELRSYLLDKREAIGCPQNVREVWDELFVSRETTAEEDT